MEDKYNKYYNNIGLFTMISATRALLKFHHDHQGAEGATKQLQAYLNALEEDDFQAALKLFHAIPLGRMGCIDDWFPPVVYEHENEEYVDAVFRALIERIFRLMKRAAGEYKGGKEKWWY